MGSRDGGGDEDFDDDGAEVMVWVVLVSMRIVFPCVDLLPRECTVLSTSRHLITHVVKGQTLAYI